MYNIVTNIWGIIIKFTLFKYYSLVLQQHTLNTELI